MSQPGAHVHTNCDFISPHLTPVAGIPFDSGSAVTAFYQYSEETAWIITCKVLLYLKTLVWPRWLESYLKMPILHKFLEMAINPNCEDATCGQHQISRSGELSAGPNCTRLCAQVLVAQLFIYSCLIHMLNHYKYLNTQHYFGGKRICFSFAYALVCQVDFA